MASGDILAIPAQSAGFFSLQGSLSVNSDNTVNVPAGQLNIGGNGYGYIVDASNGLNPFSAANNDGTVSALTLGDDIYMYACQQASGKAKIVFSKNATYPTGYNASNSRKAGGFHVGRTRPIANRFDAEYNPTANIVPGSAWDLGHRPRCGPEGMNEFQPGLWGSIYLLSVINGSWPSVTFGSRYNAAPVRSTGGYNELDLHRGLHAAGMREPTFEEWLMMAYGAPQGNDGNNTTAWTMTTNTGPCNTGTVAKSVSCANFVDCVGNLWERLAHHFDVGDVGGGAQNWRLDNTVVNTGQDSAFDRGSVGHVLWQYARAGGSWGGGVLYGSRTLDTNAAAWAAHGAVGVRGVSESL